MQLKLGALKIMLATQSADFRKSIDGLCSLITAELGHNTLDAVYVFYNKSRDKLKLIAWHHNGFILLYKRLEKGKFKLEKNPENPELLALNEKQISWLLAGLDWQLMSNCEEISFDNYH